MTAIDPDMAFYARSEAAAGRNWDDVGAEIGLEPGKFPRVLHLRKPLSPSERVVCTMIADGLNLQEIGARIGKKPHTVGCLATAARRKGYPVPKFSSRPHAPNPHGPNPSEITLKARAMFRSGCSPAEVRAALKLNRNQTSGIAFRMRRDDKRKLQNAENRNPA